MSKRNLVEYAVVDHRKDMLERHVADPQWAYTVIFGNLVAGAKLMEKALTTVADMPVRLGVYGSNEGSTIVYHMMSSLLQSHHSDLNQAGQGIDHLVKELCDELEAKLSEGKIPHS